MNDNALAVDLQHHHWYAHTFLHTHVRTQKYTQSAVKHGIHLITSSVKC